jgi:hypothetical protein
VDDQAAQKLSDADPANQVVLHHSVLGTASLYQRTADGGLTGLPLGALSFEPQPRPGDLTRGHSEATESTALIRSAHRDSGQD